MLGQLQKALCVAIPAIFVSCGGSGEPSKTPDSETGFGDDVDASDDSSDGSAPRDNTDRTPAGIATTGSPPPKPTGDFEVTYRDCSALHSNYKKLLRQDEMAKLKKKKLPPKVHEKALGDIEKIIKEGADQWLGQCEGIVGSVQVRPRWHCAQDATDLERFNGCMDGQFDDEFK